MKTLKLIAIVSTLLATPAFATDAKEELEILEVKGSGSGCSTDTWEATINKSEKAIAVAFQDFIVDSEEGEKSKYCNLSVYFNLPAGQTFYTYSFEVFGDADMAASTSATVRTSLRLPNGQSKSHRYNIKKGLQGSWDTSSRKPSGPQAAPCGGKRVRLDYRIKIDLNGNDGVAKIAGKLGKFSRLFYKTRPCS